MKEVLKLVAKRPAGSASRVFRSFVRSFEEPPRSRAARLETKRVLLPPPIVESSRVPLLFSLLSFLLGPSPSHSVCFPFGSTTPPRHTLSLSLLLCFCNLFVSASSGFLFPPPPSCSFVPTVPVRESRRPPTEPPSHTHRTAGASLSPEVLALESLVRAPATPGPTDLLSTSSWDNPR